MRILVISNLYPPYYVGGYELGCRNVVEALRARGHEVRVLTSTYGVNKHECNGEIHRLLEADLKWGGQGLACYIAAKLFKKEFDNQNALKRVCRIYRPHIIYVWNLTHISVSLASMAQRMGVPVCYFVFDNWLSRWESDPWYSLWHHQPRRFHRRSVWKLLRFFLNVSGSLSPSISLDLRHVQFASQFLKDVALRAGKPVADAEVIHWGLDVNSYPYREFFNNPKRLLYVGQIVQHKGLHTAVQALKILVQQHRHESAMLTIVGGTILPDYEAYVRSLVHSFGLERNVRFIGLIPPEHLPPIYQEHDILIFPSVWDEPFGITLLEGMSSGLAIVGTATGGSREILEHEVNGLIFPKEDVKGCATQMLRLLDDQELFERIRQGGRRTVEENFRFEITMDKIENSVMRTMHNVGQKVRS